jgi:hypothetical protein
MGNARRLRRAGPRGTTTPDVGARARGPPTQVGCQALMAVSRCVSIGLWCRRVSECRTAASHVASSHSRGLCRRSQRRLSSGAEHRLRRDVSGVAARRPSPRDAGTWARARIHNVGVRGLPPVEAADVRQGRDNRRPKEAGRDTLDAIVPGGRHDQGKHGRGVSASRGSAWPRRIPRPRRGSRFLRMALLLRARGAVLGLRLGPGRRRRNRRGGPGREATSTAPR